MLFFFPPQKEPKSASVKLVLNHTKIVLYVIYIIKIKLKYSLSRSVSACRGYSFFVAIPQALPLVAKEVGVAVGTHSGGKALDVKTKYSCLGILLGILQIFFKEVNL